MPDHGRLAIVRAAIAADYIRVRLERGFTSADVEALKRISGRRWEPDTLSWRLPSSDGVIAALDAQFGERLVLYDVDDPGPRLRPTVATRATDKDLEAAAGSGDPEPHERDVAAPDSSVPAVPVIADFVGMVAELRRVVRLREYSRKTETAYASWLQRYGAWAGTCDGMVRLDEASLVAFLEHLEHEGLAARSRNQAASALNFVLRNVLQRDDVSLPRAKGPVRMPLVLTHHEVMRVLHHLQGKYRLIGMLLYSSGLRIGECANLRIKDLDFELRQILVRDGKGRKDRYVPLAARAVVPLGAHIRQVLEQHSRDLQAGHGWAPLPGALHRKDPGAGYEPRWQFLFPAGTLNTDPVTGRSGRWSLHVTAAERAFKAAVRSSGITKRATCHTLRHSFATETLRSGCDIRTLQHVMGHRDIRTTTIYLHVVQQTGMHIRSPLDRPDDHTLYDDDLRPVLLPGQDSQPVTMRPEGERARLPDTGAASSSPHRGEATAMSRTGHPSVSARRPPSSSRP